MINKFYLVEDKKVVELKDNGILEIEPYTKIIKIDQVRETLKDYLGLAETQEFKDWYIYSNDCMEINVTLQSESNFYDVKRSIELKEFLQIVQNIFFVIIKSLSDECLSVIDGLMKKFNLNLYNAIEKKHYTNIKELKEALKRMQLV